MEHDVTADWFRDAFDDLYLTVYQHRDRAEADRILAWLGPRLDLAGARVLDLACGAARFAAPLTEAGARYVGLDLSLPLLRAARRDAPALALVRADMRSLPLAPGRFDAVLSMFTSFGYFENDDENRAVLDGVARVLRPGGHFVVDLLNARRTRETLVPRSRREAGGHVVDESREIRGNRVVKNVRISRPGGEAVRAYTESVRIFESADIEAWGRAVGVEPVDRWGDYGGSPFDVASSPRLLMLFLKKAGA